MVDSRVRQPVVDHIPNAFDGNAQSTFSLVALITSSSDGHFGAFDDAIPDDRVLARVDCALVVEQQFGWQTHSAAPVALDWLGRVEWTLSAVFGEVLQFNHNYAALGGVIAFSGHLVEIAVEEFGRRLHFVMRDLGSVDRTGGRPEQRRLYPSANASLAEDVSARLHFVRVVQNAETNRTNDVFVYFAIESRDIETHFDSSLVISQTFQTRKDFSVCVRESDEWLRGMSVRLLI